MGGVLTRCPSLIPEICAFAYNSILVVRQQAGAIVSEPNKPVPSPAAQAAKLRGILESAVTAIITIDEQGLIENINPATQRLFGYSASELVGKNVKVLMPEPYRAEHDG